jgi:ribosomal protein S18 acetylase RimI-like enzyme
VENNVIIRESMLHDADVIGELLVEFFEFHAQHDPLFAPHRCARERFSRYVQQLLVNPEARVCVAQVQERIVGFAIATIRNKPQVYKKRLFGEIDTVAVTRAYRRRGIGAQLYSHLRCWLLQRGITRIEIMAALTNPQSVPFWQKMGFSQFMMLCAREEDPGTETFSQLDMGGYSH